MVVRPAVFFALLLSISVLLLGAGRAHAESPLEVEARRHFTLAQKLFDSARYAEALVEYQKSYELSHYPAILYKVALCHDQLGQESDAVAAYQRYLALDPQSERRAGIEERVGKLSTLHEAEPPAPKPVEPPAPAVATPTPQPQLAQPVHAAEARRTPIYKKWWLWTIVGAAAVGASVGIALAVTLKTSPTPDSFDKTLGSFGPGLVSF
jgi:tetratricopeptide (TPR) repeat protein